MEALHLDTSLLKNLEDLDIASLEFGNFEFKNSLNLILEYQKIRASKYENFSNFVETH